MKHKIIFILIICLYFFSKGSKGQINGSLDILQVLQDNQYQLVYQDVISEILALDESIREKLGIVNSADIIIESFISELKFAKGDSILLFYPIDYPEQQASKKVLKMYKSFLTEIKNNNRIPFNLIKEFDIEVDIYVNEYKRIHAFYTLKYDGSNLIISNKKIIYI
jgi:hypothetical protein